MREKRICSEMENWSYRMKSCHLTERDLLYQEVDRCYLNKMQENLKPCILKMEDKKI